MSLNMGCTDTFSQLSSCHTSSSSRVFAIIIKQVVISYQCIDAFVPVTIPDPEHPQSIVHTSNLPLVEYCMFSAGNPQIEHIANPFALCKRQCHRMSVPFWCNSKRK